MTTLLLSSRHTEDNQQIWRAATQRGWNVERVRGITLPIFNDDRVVLYIESLYTPTIAKKLDLQLLETPEDWLESLPENYRRRNIKLTTLRHAWSQAFPAFIKPPNDKAFAARVYRSADELPTEYEPTTPVLVATPLDWLLEFRCFCLDNRVRTLSPYLREGQLSKLDGYSASDRELSEARTFAESVLSDCRVRVPRAIVLDVGVIKGAGWAVVEANAAWGSGIYGCDPNETLNVIEHAVTKPSAESD
jgi:hypothetical protein